MIKYENDNLSNIDPNVNVEENLKIIDSLNENEIKINEVAGVSEQSNVVDRSTSHLVENVSVNNFQIDSSVKVEKSEIDQFTISKEELLIISKKEDKKRLDEAEKLRLERLRKFEEMHAKESGVVSNMVVAGAKYAVIGPAAAIGDIPAIADAVYRESPPMTGETNVKGKGGNGVIWGGIGFLGGMGIIGGFGLFGGDGFIRGGKGVFLGGTNVMGDRTTSLIEDWPKTAIVLGTAAVYGLYKWGPSRGCSVLASNCKGDSSLLCNSVRGLCSDVQFDDVPEEVEEAKKKVEKKSEKYEKVKISRGMLKRKRRRRV